MSLWARAQQLPPESLQRVRAIYTEHFPIEVRICLAQWIESRICTPELEEHPCFVDELVKEIQTSTDLMMSPDNFLTMMKLLEAAKYFMQFSNSPHELYAYMRRCLLMEMEVVQKAGAPYTERKYSELITGLQAVRQEVSMVSEDIRTLQANIESFSLRYHECLKNKGHLNYLQQSALMSTERREMEACLRVQIEESEKALNSLVAQINQSQMQVVDHMKDNIANLRQLSQEMDEELIKWKWEQQLSSNGVPMTSNLNTIQDWCEQLTELIWTSRQQVINMARINGKTMIELRQPHLMEMLVEMSKQVINMARINGKTMIELRQPHHVEMLEEMRKQCDTGNIIEVEFLPTAVETESNTVSPVQIESNSVSPVPSESNSASPVRSESHAVSSPIARELNTDFLVPSESNAVASPMPSVPNMSSTPIQSERNVAAFSIKSERNEATSPMSSESNAAAFPMSSESNAAAFPMSSESNAAAFLVPSERNAAAFPMPSERNAAAFPMPSERNAAAFLVPSERNAAAFLVPSDPNAAAFLVPSDPNAAAFLVPSDPNAAASLVPSVSGQVPSPSSETYSVMRVRKRRRADFERLKYLKSIATSLERLTKTYCKRHKI